MLPEAHFRSQSIISHKAFEKNLFYVLCIIKKYHRALAEEAEQVGISLNALVAQKLYITTQIGQEKRAR